MSERFLSNENKFETMENMEKSGFETQKQDQQQVMK